MEVGVLGAGEYPKNKECRHIACQRDADVEKEDDNIEGCSLGGDRRSGEFSRHSYIKDEKRKRENLHQLHYRFPDQRKISYREEKASSVKVDDIRRRSEPLCDLAAGA
jgi:hypothetical protein